MGRSAAAANTYGVSMDELLGYITAVQEVTRDSGANIGRVADVKSFLIDLELPHSGQQGASVIAA